jgi:hypothetical protein
MDGMETDERLAEAYESPIEGLRATGASTGERDIVEWITRHAKEEGVLLERYEHLARESTSPAARYLVELIMEDERRHHRVLAQIAHTIAWGSFMDPDLAVPRLIDGVADSELVEEAKKLLASEKRDRTELRRLRRRLRTYSGTIWPLLIDAMLLDTKKHMRILRHVVTYRPG